MSLLCAYSDSSSSTGSDNGQEETQQLVTAATDLPSVDDLFSSTATSVLSGPAASRFATSFKSTPNQEVNKRRPDAPDLRAADAKRVKGSTDNATPSTSSTTKSPARQAKPFAPPQLKRPNVSTEDTGAWNTQTTMKHHERNQKPSN